MLHAIFFSNKYVTPNRNNNLLENVAKIWQFFKCLVEPLYDNGFIKYEVEDTWWI